ncbi:MAG: hypothetical protein ACOYNS_12240 [Bacteroidota bacterium]
MNSTLKYLFRLILSGVMLICLVYLNIFFQSQFGWYSQSTLFTVVLLSIAIGIVSVQLFKSVVFILASGTSPSPWVLTAHSKGIVFLLRSYFSEQVSLPWKKRLRLYSWSAVIILFVSFLHSMEVFGKSEDFFLGAGVFKNYYQTKQCEQVPVVRFTMFTEDNNVKKYLENILHISKDLRRAGAKVVVVRMPFGRIAAPSNFERIEQLTRSIDSLGYVVSAIVPFPGFRPYSSQPFSEDITRVVFSALPSDGNYSHRYDNELIQWYPLRQFPNGKKKYSEVDVSFSVAKKYFGIPDSVQPLNNGNEIVMDRIRVPVTKEGKAYSDDFFHVTPFSPVSAHRGVFQNANDRSEDDSVKYWVDVFAPGSVYKSDKEKIENLDRFRDVFEGKVVIIGWYNGSEQSVLAYPFDGFYVSSIISSVLMGKSYVNHSWLFYTLLMIIVLIIGVTAMNLGPAWSAVSAILAGIAVTTFGIWSFFYSHMIIELLYLYLAIILSYLIFSLVKMSGMIIDQRPV